MKFKPNDWNLEARDAWVAAQARRILPGSRVLDAGAGRGRYRHLFGHCEYRTQDFGQEPATVGEYTELDYVSDVTSIPVDDAAFDAILCTEVLEHVPEPFAALREFGRILKPGGVAMLTAPLGSWIHQEPYHFYGGYTPYWYKHFLPRAGFTLESIERNAGFFRFFAQEARRYSGLLDPRRVGHLSMGNRLATGAVWAVSLPFCRIMAPALAGTLDRLRLESIATFGYHVVARRDGGRVAPGAVR